MERVMDTSSLIHTRRDPQAAPIRYAVLGDIHANLEALTAVLQDAERQGCTPAVIERLQVMLAQAPEAVGTAMNPQCAETPDATFDHHYIIIMGSKP